MNRIKLTTTTWLLVVAFILCGLMTIQAQAAPGDLDPSFGNGGKVVTSISGGAAIASDIAIQSDGKIVAAGTAYIGNSSKFALARYNTDGSLDTTFGSGGKVLGPIDSQDGASAIAIQPDGKIVAAGTAYIGLTSNFALARYNTDGSLDTTFGMGGIVLGPYISNAYANAVAIQSNGKIVVAGGAHTSSPNLGFALARYNTNGSVDTSFGSGGIVLTPPTGNGIDIANAVAIQPDGRIVAAGYSFDGTNDYFALVRYLGDSNTRRTQFDFDGDSKADISVFRPSNGTWYLQQSTNGFTGFQFGISTDKIVPADYDNDGKTDIAVYRDGTWIILQSSNNQVRYVNFGTPEDSPRPGDFDGDGQADIAVFRPSNGYWYYVRSSDNQFRAIQFGQSGDAPMLGDYDGDGKTDVAVWRPSNGFWYILRSLDSQFQAAQFGTTGDIPINGDFNGDGKSDLAVYRPSEGNWYQLRSTEGFAAVQFGNSTDLPVPADYDGDGKTDVAVFRPSEGTWYQLRSTLGFNVVQFGANGDRPIPNAFVP